MKIHMYPCLSITDPFPKTNMNISIRINENDRNSHIDNLIEKQVEQESNIEVTYNDLFGEDIV